MSDEYGQELARGFRETGSEASEVSWLVHRLRSGELCRRRLELAAYLGHAPAAVAGQHERGYTDPRVFSEARALCSRLYQWGAEVCCRAALVAYRLGPPRSNEDARAALLARKWALCPCFPCSAAADQTFREYEAHFLQRELILGAGFLACRIAALGEQNPRKGLDARAAMSIGLARDFAAGGDPSSGLLRREEKRALRALKQDLVPWLLGHERSHSDW